MLWRLRSFPDFVEPCLPSQAERPPSGRDWIHEIKHDGFRLIARRGAERVRLFTRNGHDWTERFPLIVEALYALKATTCLIDGEAITCDDGGLAEFEGLLAGAVMCISVPSICLSSTASSPGRNRPSTEQIVATVYKIEKENHQSLAGQLMRTIKGPNTRKLPLLLEWECNKVLSGLRLMIMSIVGPNSS